jgi:hypothetical protein
MSNHTARLGIITVACLTLFGIVAVLYQGIVVKDPIGLWRYALLRVGALCLALPAMAAFWRLIDWCTPGDWFNGQKNSEQQTIILCVLVLAVAWVLVSA